jgi:hypothetical protein
MILFTIPSFRRLIVSTRLQTTQVQLEVAIALEYLGMFNLTRTFNHSNLKTSI